MIKCCMLSFTCSRFSSHYNLLPLRERLLGFQTRKFLAVKVWPNCQLAGATLREVEVRLSLPLRLMLNQPVLLPFTLTFTMSPAPATLVIRTKLKHDTSTVLGDLEEDRHGEVKVRAWRVAPPAVVGGESIVRRAKVSSRDNNGRIPRVTPFWFICTLNLEACTTAKPIVEKCRA
ncbi:hypothetical protein GQ457_08G012620 [Hibiscus cannabinus]